MDVRRGLFAESSLCGLNVDNESIGVGVVRSGGYSAPEWLSLRYRRGAWCRLRPPSSHLWGWGATTWACVGGLLFGQKGGESLRAPRCRVRPQRYKASCISSPAPLANPLCIGHSERAETFIPRAPLRSRYERPHALGKNASALSVRAYMRSYREPFRAH